VAEEQVPLLLVLPLKEPSQAPSQNKEIVGFASYDTILEAE
jgi:hypothetical protein